MSGNTVRTRLKISNLCFAFKQFLFVFVVNPLLHFPFYQQRSEHNDKRRIDLKLNNRGLSLLEISAAVVLISIISVFSVTQYNKSKTKSLTKSAKLQLGHLHRMEKAYFIEHSTFTYELRGNMFPKGIQLYNVGFGSKASDVKLKPCSFYWNESAFTNNYYELCGADLDSTGTRQECGFKNKEGSTPQLNLAYKGLRANVYYKPNQHCTLNQKPILAPRSDYCNGDKLKRDFPGNEHKFYTKFIAYAVGDILDPRNFSSPANKLDVWRINGNGYLEHCQSALKASADNNYRGTCSQAMDNTEDNSSQYCS